MYSLLCRSPFSPQQYSSLNVCHAFEVFRDFCAHVQNVEAQFNINSPTRRCTSHLSNNSMSQKKVSYSDVREMNVI